MSIQTTTRRGLLTGGASIAAATVATGTAVGMNAEPSGLAVLMTRYKDARRAYDAVQTKIDELYESEPPALCKVEVGYLQKADV